MEEDSLILKDFYLIIYCHMKKFSLRFVLGFRKAFLKGGRRRTLRSYLCSKEKAEKEGEKSESCKQ